MINTIFTHFDSYKSISSTGQKKGYKRSKTYDRFISLGKSGARGHAKYHSNKTKRKPSSNGYKKSNQDSQNFSDQKRSTKEIPYTEDNPELATIKVPKSGLSVQALSERLTCTPADVVKTLFLKGVMAQINQQLDRPTVKMVCEAKGINSLDSDESDQLDTSESKNEFISEDDIDFLVPRAPIVAVMGHVDHGKTSFLDYIRKTRITTEEVGKITQSIGAYNVKVDGVLTESGIDTVCFLDTPGHEAFSTMRARGAKVTDIIIIIIAADDGVKPQTQESIDHARAANVPIVVAINKIDKIGADPERVKQQLAEIELLPEEWGGQTPVIPISCVSGHGIPDLLENLLLLAEMQELMTNPERAAKGTVLEASLDKHCGPVATLILQTGSLRVGDIVQAGSSYGKARSLRNEQGIAVSVARPCTAVQLLGLASVPLAGQIFEVVQSEAEACRRAKKHADKDRQAKLSDASGAMVTLGHLLGGELGVQTMNIILKADFIGSIEAIKMALEKLPHDKFVIRYLTATTGEITKTDLELAIASKSIVMGFNLSPSESFLSLAKDKGVEVRLYEIIYDIVDDVRDILEGMLPPIVEKTPKGTALVKAVFGGGKTGKVAGCVVEEGNMVLGNFCEVYRKGTIISEAKLSSLRRAREQVKVVEIGKECGIDVEGFKEWLVDDKIICYEVTRRRRTLEESNLEAIT